jgi:ABC-type antimicrobial peptide transport system permease subunit
MVALEAYGGKGAGVGWTNRRADPRHPLTVVGSGVLLGATVAVLTTRAMRALLFHVAALDPLTFAIVPLLLAVTGVAASLIPARQASRADPVEALRAE